MAIGIGLAGELGAIGLLMTGAWLLLSASFRPPILMLSVAIGAVQLFSFVRGCARYGERLASHNFGLRLQARLRSWLYRCLEELVPAGLPGGDRGDLLARLISDTEEAQDLVVRCAVPAVVAVAAWSAAVVTAAVLLPAAAWVLLVAGASAIAGVAVAVLTASRKAAPLPAARGDVGAWVSTALTGAEELVALGADEWALAELAERERVLGACTRAAAGGAGLGRAASVLSGGLGLAGVAWAGSAALGAGRIGPVELAVLVFLALGAAGVLQGLPDAVGRLLITRTSLERLADLGQAPRPVAAELAGRAEAQFGPLMVTRAGGQAPRRRPVPVVALRAAAVAYPNRPGRRHVVSDLDLELAPGRPVALTGPSGSGKTSVVFALLRFLDLTSGQLTVDGADTRAVPPEQVRALLAWSPEQPALFPTSLRANLRLAAPHATDGEIADLLEQLRLGPWLNQLEQGLDTVPAPWGHPVSGGELQRLSVARAILADRPILLLDEPTSHLDATTADAVLNAVLEHAADRSLLWVTHRPEEAARFPQVHVLKPRLT
jgi:ATP-binding cassette subfamily C protein CydCD